MAEWPLWRLVVEGKTTVTELETSVSIDDVMRLNALLDMKSAIELQAMEK